MPLAAPPLPSRPPALAATLLATFSVLVLLVYTDYLDGGAPGSPLALPLLAVLLAAHLPLLRSEDAGPRLPFSMSPGVLGTAAVVLALLTALRFVHMGQAALYETPVEPRSNAQLGLVTQVVARIEAAQPIYTGVYTRDGYTESNVLAPGAVLPFAAARAWGFEWRYASLAGAGLMAMLLAASMALVATRIPNTPPGRDLAGTTLFALLAGGAGWMLVPVLTPYLHWGHTMPQWPLLLGFGVALGAGLAVLAALAAGLLATMTPGWLVLLPVAGALLWREVPAGRRAMAAACLLGPAIVAYGAWRAEFTAMFSALLGETLRSQTAEPLVSATLPTLHAVGDFLRLRPGIYGAALLGLGFLARAILRCEDRGRRLSLFAFAAFLVLVCGPVAYAYHWMAHLALLCGLLAGRVLADLPAVEAGPFAGRVWSAPAARAALLGSCLLVLLPLGRLLVGFEPAVNRQPGGAQHPTRLLLAGFNVESADHAWGAEPRVAIGLPHDGPGPGTLQIKLGTLGGTFTPNNPVRIAINGHERGVFRALPGNVAYALVPMGPGDLHRGFNVVELRAAWARTPRSLNIDPTDTRTMSVFYQGLNFVPR